MDARNSVDQRLRSCGSSEMFWICQLPDASRHIWWYVYCWVPTHVTKPKILSYDAPWCVILRGRRGNLFRSPNRGMWLLVRCGLWMSQHMAHELCISSYQLVFRRIQPLLALSARANPYLALSSSRSYDTSSICTLRTFSPQKTLRWSELPFQLKSYGAGH